MKKSFLVLLLLALVASLTSACSKSANPAAPSPVAPIGGGGVSATLSIASWAIYPPGACSNSLTCDSTQALRPNAEGRYDLNPQLGYDLQVVFNNPRQNGRTVEYTMNSEFSFPQIRTGRFGQTDPGVSAQHPSKVGFNVTNTSANPVVVFEAIESGSGLNEPTRVRFEAPVRFMR